jgi:hypothetical protein
MGPYWGPGGPSQIMPDGVTKKYRILFGTHIEAVPGQITDVEKGTGYRIYRQGEVFETRVDYDRWNTKMRNITAEGVSANTEIWDYNRESIEQFVARMTVSGRTGLQRVDSNTGWRQQPPQQPPTPEQPPSHPTAAQTPPQPPPGERMDGSLSDTYGGMTVEELRRHAAMEQINLQGARTKEEIIRVLLRHVRE